MIFSEFSSFLSIIDWFNKRISKNQPEPKDSVAVRFVQLFEAHGVHRNQIPRFFGFDLKLADVSDDEKLLKVLNEDMLDAATERFAIRREWLDGASDQIYDTHHFYKYPKDFAEFIDKLKARTEYLGGLLYVPEQYKGSRDKETLIVLEEQIGEIGDKQIYRYHLCNGWVFNYWKCRAYITACIAIAWKRNIYIHGSTVKAKDLEKYTEGQAFPPLSEIGGISRLTGQRFDPEGMTLDPAQYLAGVDEGEFGEQAALGHWLMLAEQGWMDSGFDEPPVEAFKVLSQKTITEST